MQLKSRLLAGLLLLAAAAGATPPAGAAQAAPPQRELTVTIVGQLTRGRGSFDDFARMQAVFTRVFNAHRWPVKVTVERFASNNPDHDLELRVFVRRAFEETPGELTFEAWMTLFQGDKEHDFGIIKYRYPDFGTDHVRSDILDATIAGAAEMAAKKIEAVLFPQGQKGLT